MRDENKTKAQLISELTGLRQQSVELKTSEAERGQAEDLLRAQRDLGLALSATAGLETLRLCVEVAIRVSGMDCGGVYLVDETSGGVDLAFHKGLPPAFVKSASHYDADSSSARLVMAGQPIYTRYQELDVSLDKARRREGLRAIAIIPVRYEGRVIACLNIASHTLDKVPDFARTALETIAAQIGSVITRSRAEEALRRRNRELALLNQTSRAFVSTLDLDQVLVTILEEVCQLLGVTASSVWLVDPETDALVCQQASGPRRDTVLGWRLALGEGIAGWVAHHGETLIVPDTRADERHFKGVDRQTRVELCSILSVPLKVKQHVIGVLQVADTEVGRFATSDLALVEPLAAAAAIAIENAQLYAQAQRDAETKSVLLREINHRVKNNLTGIMGLLYAARDHARVEDWATYQSTMNGLIGRVRGLATVHSMLSASEWTPLRLSALAGRVIHAALPALPRDKHVSIDVSPSPVRVTPDQAHNLTLVINELATNTIKHALGERDTAHITFQIACDDNVTVRTVRCEFRDDGPGYPEDVLQLEHHHVGFDLIQNIVRHSLRGELSLHNERGAVAVIRFEAKV